MRNRQVGPALFAAGVLLAGLLFVGALDRLDAGRRTEGIEQLEQAVRRGAVACYAAEGIYPPTLEYLEQHYGIQVDRTRYRVIYDVYASNRMPDVTVLEKEP